MSVTVYTKPSCPQCNLTKSILDKNNIPFTSVDLSQDEEAMNYVVSLGYSAAPVVVVDEEQHWSGFRPERIASLKV